MNKPTRRSHLLVKRIPLFCLSLYIAIYVLSGYSPELTTNLFPLFTVATEEIPPTEEDFLPPSTFALSDLENHPKPLLTAFVANANVQPYIADFHALLEQYRVRQSQDDNFTIRVIDNRTDAVLDLYTLEEEKAIYQATREMDWLALDQKRRTITRQLSKKHQAQGIPRKAITIRWGRANQVHEARQRELPYIEYELRLAHFHGLSLLATEVGTVETFNSDELVSSVGAKSRYQLMPSMLRKHGIHSYHLTTSGNRTVIVNEERHPLLTMVPAFFIMRGYANTVGHEMPGISAYHTGPGNIFGVYRMFLENNPSAIASEASVVDAFVWGVTDGFPKVSQKSTFKNHSRGYIPSTYGSLRATEDLPLDLSKTMRAEQVQLKPGAVVYLSELLDYLQVDATDVGWGPFSNEPSLYAKFRALNQHWSLPETDDVLFLPPEADVKIVAKANNRPVRFFLPRGASDALTKGGHTFLDPTKRVIFDETSFHPPSEDELLPADHVYRALIADIQDFGFTEPNLRTLDALVETFEAEAAANPTFFRTTQRDVAKLHAAMWHSKPWTKLAVGVRRALRQAATP